MGVLFEEKFGGLLRVSGAPDLRDEVRMNICVQVVKAGKSQAVDSLEI